MRSCCEHVGRNDAELNRVAFPRYPHVDIDISPCPQRVISAISPQDSKSIDLAAMTVHELEGVARSLGVSSKDCLEALDADDPMVALTKACEAMQDRMKERVLQHLPQGYSHRDPRRIDHCCNQ